MDQCFVANWRFVVFNRQSESALGDDNARGELCEETTRLAKVELGRIINIVETHPRYPASETIV